MSTIVEAISSPIVTYIHFSGPGPKAARGNTAARTRRSTTRKQPTSATPAANSPTVAVAVRWIPATLTTSAAAPSSSSDHTGTRMPPGTTPSGRRAGNAPGTRTTTTAVMIANEPKAQRHIPNWANRPPAAGPTRVLTPHIADTNADARVHSEAGSAA